MNDNLNFVFVSFILKTIKTFRKMEDDLKNKTMVVALLWLN
jgi:hypothetical protein